MWPFKKKKIYFPFEHIEFVKAHLIFSDKELVIISHYEWLKNPMKNEEIITWGKNEYKIQFIKNNCDNFYIYLEKINASAQEAAK